VSGSDRGLQRRTAADRLIQRGTGLRIPVSGGSIGQAFQRWVDRRPDAAAIRFAGRTTTYAELDAGSSRIGQALLATGVTAGPPVAVCLERHVDLVAAVLGVLAAGAPYLPLDPDGPALRLAAVLADAGTRTVVTRRRLAPRFRALGVETLCLDDAVRWAPPIRPPVPVHDRSLAYVLYTSGTTGAPKGVAVEHRSVLNFSADTARRYGIGESTRVLALAPVTYDVSVLEIFGTLLAGGTLVLASDDDRGSLGRLTRLIQREAIEVAELPPALMALVEPAVLPALRVVSTGGEAPPASLVGPWTAGNRRFVNGYGPTEATVGVTAAECAGEWHGTLPIGLPIMNHRVYVLDDTGGLAPDGAPGELAVNGPGLARGYLGRPAATAERFVPDPYAGRPGQRMYRTGDVVRWRPDGQLEFVGRLDRQVKLRGHRVEPGEIESALLQVPGIRQAVVEYLSHRDQLVSWVVGDDLGDDAHLRTVLARRLPLHMMPGRFVRPHELPVTAAGKVDRRVLRASISAREEFDVTDPTAHTDDREYIVVRNDEHQYSIWATDRPVPAGWHPVGEPADRATCLDHIEKVWTDLRPRSVREGASAGAAVAGDFRPTA
jgi:amino acid adenylation domain-containing protein